MNTNQTIIPARSAPTRTALVAASLILHSPFSILNSSASVPLRWTVETSRVQPAVFDVVRGETIELEAAFTSYGKPVATTNQTAFLAWQTNGMDSAWWITNATTSTSQTSQTPNLAHARFTPAMDPGAPTVTGFIGLSDATNTSSLIPHPSSLSYRAAFTLRFRRGPGATPNAIEQPPRVLDLARTVVINPPWPTQADFAATTTVMKAELKTYVDSEIEGAGLVTPQSVTNTVTNVVTKAYVEGLGINAGLTTNDVSGVITNHVTSGYLAPASALASLASLQSLSSATQATLNAAKRYAEEQIDAAGHWVAEMNDDDVRPVGQPSYNDSENHWEWTVVHTSGRTREARSEEEGNICATNLFFTYNSFSRLSKMERFYAHRFPIARISDLTNAYTRAASDARYAPTSTAVTVASHASQLSQLSQSVTAKADAAVVSQLNVQVQALGANANAEDARVIVTNYNSATRMPEAQFDVKVSNSWITVWHEMTRWNGFLGCFSAYTNGVASTLANKGEKEWGWFDSATGSPSPEGILQLSQPRIQVCSGAAYQRYVSTTGSAWVLESNGLVADINGTTNGYFRITDEEGNTHFEIVKGDKQSLFATAKTMTQQQMGVTHYFTTYAVTNAVSAPVAQFSRSLSPATWIKESEAGNPCNVSWTNNGDNSWTVEWWPIGNEPVLFMKAGYERGGETYIRNAVPVSMQYIYLGNTKYLLGTAAIDGHTVLTLTAQ